MKHFFKSILLLFLLILLACLVAEPVIGPAENTTSVPESSSGAEEEPLPESSSGTEKEPLPDSFPQAWRDDGIFSEQYAEAYDTLLSMTQEEKVGQLFLARCHEEVAVSWAETFHPAGFVLFRNNFDGKDRLQVQNMVDTFQKAANLPLLMAVDEEGGTVVRVSSHPALCEKPFRAPRELYGEGGLQAVSADAAAKAKLLKKLGLTTNFAPVCDLSDCPDDFIYARSVSGDPQIAADFAEKTVEISMAEGVLPCLKHFPGYGGNADTHTGLAVDDRPYETFVSRDFIPFSAGIGAGAPLVMLSHTIVNSIDADHPASLSKEAHRVLREELHFTGVMVTDDLAMGAIQAYTGKHHPAVAALLAGNHLLLVDHLPENADAVLQAAEDGVIAQDTIDHAAFLVLAMKYSAGLL